MPTWPYRHQLSLHDRLRRSVYEVLRDHLDTVLVKQALIASYLKFCAAREPYPFVNKRELKPRARVVEKEYANHNHFLVIYCEGSIPPQFKKYIRFFDGNKVTTDAIGEFAHIQLQKKYSPSLRFFDNPSFPRLVLDLLSVDYALLIQRDSSVKRRTRYVLSHFHVRIDWPLDDAAEDMAQQLRYVSKDLYERGEKYAEHLNHKLFEMYGFHPVVGGRRTAAVVAAQFLRRMEFVSTVYVASTEARALTRLSERGVSKFVLIKLPIAEIKRVANDNRLGFDQFVERYIIDLQDDYGVAILQVVYRNNVYSKPPEDNKLRKLRPDYQWLTVSNQLLIPLPEYTDTYPVPYSTIYSADSS